MSYRNIKLARMSVNNVVVSDVIVLWDIKNSGFGWGTIKSTMLEL